MISGISSFIVGSNALTINPSDEAAVRTEVNATATFIQSSSFGTRFAFITSFLPEPYDLLKELPVAITPAETGYIATLYDANIHASGDNPHEAYENLKGLILDIFELLSHSDPSTLGPEPTRQLAFLRAYIQPI